MSHEPLRLILDTLASPPLAEEAMQGHHTTNISLRTSRNSFSPKMSLDIEHVANLCRVDFGVQKRAVASHSELMQDEIRLHKTQQADE